MVYILGMIVLHPFITAERNNRKRDRIYYDQIYVGARTNDNGDPSRDPILNPLR